MAPVRPLLQGIVDYAGLFPPTSAPMAEAVAEYARQLRSEERWMLAAFVVPVSRLAEFGEAAAPRTTVATEGLHRLEDLRALETSDDVAQQLAQPTHVVVERTVDLAVVVGRREQVHGRSLRTRRAGRNAAPSRSPEACARPCLGKATTETRRLP